jgi:arylformamidase
LELIVSLAWALLRKRHEDREQETSGGEQAVTTFAPSSGDMPPDPRRAWSSRDQVARDAAYNNNLAVANSAALIEARNAASETFRAKHAGALDIPYANGERTRFDLYPAADNSAPCLVFIHGGYWQRNSREVFAIMAEGALVQGWSVAIPGYTLAPAASIAQIVGEMRAALDWLSTNGASHGIAGPIVVSGWSAGAQLAALALSHEGVVAGLAISGVYDLAPIRDTYLNAALKTSDDEIATLSPLRLSVISKPMTIAYGSKELPALVCDARNFHALRAAAHVPGALLPVAGADHFTILDELRSKDGLLLRAARDLVEGRP